MKIKLGCISCSAETFRNIRLGLFWFIKLNVEWRLTDVPSSGEFISEKWLQNSQFKWKLRLHYLIVLKVTRRSSLHEKIESQLLILNFFYLNFRYLYVTSTWERKVRMIGMWLRMVLMEYFVDLSVLRFLAVIAWAASRWLEGHLSLPFQAADFDFHFLRIHDVAALPYAGNGLIRAVWADGKVARHCVTLAIPAASICREGKLDAIRNRHLPCVSDKMASNCWIKFVSS